MLFIQILHKHLKLLQISTPSHSHNLPVPLASTNPYYSTSTYIQSCLTNNNPISTAIITSFFRLHHDSIALRSIPQRNHKDRQLLQNHHQQFLHTLPSNAILCYTDGSYSSKSRTSQSATLIYLAPNSNGIEIVTIPVSHSPFEAELTAILSTLKYLRTLPLTLPIIYIFTDSQEAQKELYKDQSTPPNHTTITRIRNLMSQLEPTIIHIHWIGSHINNPHHDQAHRLASTKTSTPNRINTAPTLWKTDISKLPHPQKDFILKPGSTTTLPPISTSGYTAQLVAKTYLTHIYESLPELPPFTTDIIKHCIPTHHFQKIPWQANHLLVSGLRAPYVWTTDLTQLPSNTIGFANPETEPLFSHNRWIPTSSSQICLAPMTKNNLLTTISHIQTNLSTQTNRPWSISFIYSSHYEPPPDLPPTSLHKILSYTTRSNSSYTIWTYCKSLSDCLDPPLSKPHS